MNGEKKGLLGKQKTTTITNKQTKAKRERERLKGEKTTDSGAQAK